MFAEDATLGWRSDDVPSIQLDLTRTVECTGSNCMRIDAAKSHYLHFGRKTCTTLGFPGPNDVVDLIPQAVCTKDRRILYGSLISPAA